MTGASATALLPAVEAPVLVDVIRSSLATLCVLGFVVLGQDPVERLAGLGQDRPCPCYLRFGPRADDLYRGQVNLLHHGAHVNRGAGRVAGHGRPRLIELVAMLGHVLLALLGQLVGAASALAALLLDEVFILELSQGRVDRSRTGAPEAAAALVDLLDDLVAVHRPLGEQRESRRTDVTAPRAPAPPAAATWPAAELHRPAVHAGSEEAGERRAVPAPAGVRDVRVVVVVTRDTRQSGCADLDPLPAAAWAAVPVMMISLVHRMPPDLTLNLTIR